jgi:LysM repeat protein
MASPSSARWIAPAALLVAILAVAIVYSSSTSDGDQGSGPPSSSEPAEERPRTDRTTPRTQTTPPATTPTTTTAAGSYTVQPGDTLGSIAAENGTTVEELQELNPGVDSSSLSVGQDIKLP